MVYFCSGRKSRGSTSEKAHTINSEFFLSDGNKDRSKLYDEWLISPKKDCKIAVISTEEGNIYKLDNDESVKIYEGVPNEQR